MTRIAYFSDIHTEINCSRTRLAWSDHYPLDLGPNVRHLINEVDLVILAGDIGSGREKHGTSALSYAQSLSEYLDVPVILVPGNHEYYGFVFEDTRKDMLDAKIPNVYVLDRGSIVLDINGEAVRILGATLWTDYEVMEDRRLAMLDAKRMLNDHRLIKTMRGDVWEPNDAASEHYKSRDWLLQELERPFNGKTVIATHHCPHIDGDDPSIPKRPLSASFFSNCDDVIRAAIKNNVSAWIFGHTHYSTQFSISYPDLNGKLDILSAQMGYNLSNRSNPDSVGILDLRMQLDAKPKDVHS